MISFIRNIISEIDSHTMEVLKKSFSSSLVKIIGVITSLAVSLYLGRSLGAEGLGIINLANKIVTLLMVFTLFGFPLVLIKELAISYNKNDMQRIGDCMSSSYIFNGIVSFLVVLIFILLAPWISDYVFNSPKFKIPFMIAIVMLIPMVFSRIHMSGLIGYKKIWQSNLVNQTLSIWIVGVLLLVSSILKFQITLVNVAIMYAFGRISVSIFALVYWRKLYTYKGKTKNITLNLLKTDWPLFFVSASGIIAANSDAIMLGWLQGTYEVGIYTVAARIALLTIFFLQVTNSAVAPKVAAMFANNEFNELEKMIQRITGGLFFFGLFTFFIFILKGEWLLGFWGNEFTDAYWILIIIAFGQFINLSTGAVGLLLMMTGYEKTQGMISLVFLILNLVLNYILILKFGVIGAAIATSVTLAGENIVKCYFVNKFLKISPFPFFK
jgi:O-antigen/teichoic acid export membrane protein